MFSFPNGCKVILVGGNCLYAKTDKGILSGFLTIKVLVHNSITEVKFIKFKKSAKLKEMILELLHLNNNFLFSFTPYLSKSSKR